MAAKTKAQLTSWKVIEIFDTDVPKRVLEPLQLDLNSMDPRVYGLMWKDVFFYHGEDGWVLNDACLEICEDWLDKQARQLGLAENEVFWFRIKVS